MLSSNQFFIGEIIRESLIDESILAEIQCWCISSRTTAVENFTPSVWNINRYRLPKENLYRLLPKLEANIASNQWYIHFYAEGSNDLYVILPGRIFRLPKTRDSSWDQMISYGEVNGIGRRWTETIPVDFPDLRWHELEIAKQFALLMDQNRYSEAGCLMATNCRYIYMGTVIEGVEQILATYISNYESAQKQLDEVLFYSEVVPGSRPNLFKLKYLDRIRKGPSWFEHRCEQQITIENGKVKQIEHFDLPGEPEKLKEWFAGVGIKRQ